jgi:hypothetical protein
MTHEENCTIAKGRRHRVLARLAWIYKAAVVTTLNSVTCLAELAAPGVLRRALAREPVVRWADGNDAQESGS